MKKIYNRDATLDDALKPIAKAIDELNQAEITFDMGLVNQSSRKGAEVRSLVKFVQKRCQKSEKTIIVLLDHDKGEGAAGLAGPHGTHFMNISMKRPGYTQIWMRVGDEGFPTTSFYRKAVGQVEFADWQEEFVFVLAHELRHIDQFFAMNKVPYHFEVDAERFAVKVLNEYRQQIGRPVKVPEYVTMESPTQGETFNKVEQLVHRKNR